MTDTRIAYSRPMRLAVLIDAENASSKVAEVLFAEIASLGEASARRIYGDASSPALRNWVAILPQWGIQWQQNFQNTKGKNSGDIALVIDAMDLMHSGRFDGFCLVSSDSDFTRLAARIREQGYPVYGFGEQKTPESFRQACTRFIYLENLLAPLKDAEADPSPSSEPVTKRPLQAAENLIIKVMHDADDDGDGWVALGLIGNRLRNAYPDFDHRSYGFAKLSSLIKASKRFEVVQSTGNGLNVRLK